MQRRTQRAFTLIELLVVIAIIAILAAILFPVFAKARERANSTACLSNTKQIGLAIMAYTDDYEGKYPKDYDPDGVHVWKDAIVPYLGSGKQSSKGATSIYTCPSNSFAWAPTSMGGYGALAGAATTNGQVLGDNTGRWPRSYGYNGSIFATHTNVTMTDIKNPAGFIAIIESRLDAADLGAWWISGGDEGQDGYVWGSPNGRYIGDGALGHKYGKYQSHMGGLNFTFCDGHASWYKLARTISDPQMWNPWPQGAYASNPGQCYLNKMASILPEYK